MRYEVPIVYKGLSIYVVEADTPDEAKEKAEDLYYEGTPALETGSEWEEIDHVGAITEVKEHG